MLQCSCTRARIRAQRHFVRVGAPVAFGSAETHECGPDARCRSTAQVAEGFDNDSFESSTVSNRAEVRVSWALKDALRMTVQFVGSLT